MNRTRHALKEYPDRQPSERLRREREGYRIASEILDAIADMGASDQIYDFVWSIVEREGCGAKQ